MKGLDRFLPRSAEHGGLHHALAGGWLAGQLALFEQEAGVIKRQAALLAVKDAGNIVRQVLLLREAHHLADDVEGRRAGLHRHDGIAQARDCELLIPQATRQTPSIDVQCEVDTCDDQVEVIGVPDTEIDLQALLERSGIERGDVGYQHVRGLALDKPGSAARNKQENQSSCPPYHGGDIISEHPTQSDGRRFIVR